MNEKDLDVNIIDLIRMGEGLLDYSEICKTEGRKAGKLADALEGRRMTLSIIGQFKRGKSSLINNMLGNDILPVGIIPITSVVTKIEDGEDKAFVYFEDGSFRETTRDELPKFISEQENPDNLEGVQEVLICTKSPLVSKGISLVDTPGVGSVHKNNTKVAYDFIRESDGAVFMLSVDSPVNEIEIEFLKEAKAYPGSFYFVVNKRDMVGDDDLKIYMEYCKKLISDIMEIPVEEVKLFATSAKTGDGVEELKNYVLKDLTTRRKEIMENSAAKRMVDIINRGLMRMTLYWSATRMSTGNFDFKFTKLREGMEELYKDFHEKIEIGIESGISQAALIMNLNIFKKSLTEKVHEYFDIDYQYEVEGVKLTGEEISATKREVSLCKKQAEDMCQDLENTLNTLLLYREDDSIVVAKRIRSLKKITNNLKAIRGVLEDAI